MAEEKNYNIVRTAELLGIKVRTVRQWIRDGKLKAVKYDVSNRWFIPESEIERLRNGQKSGK